MQAAGVVWLALDGVGHPDDAPEQSVWDQELPTLRPLVESGAAVSATLGVPGLPQSGTGQSCWLTGTDAVRHMGEHFGPHPGPTLRALLRDRALPGRIVRAGGRVALANAYAPAFFEAHVGQEGQGNGRPARSRLGCFPYAFLAAGQPLNPPGAPLVSASLGLGYSAPWPVQSGLDTLARQGEALGRWARSTDLTVLDLWFSDLLGHQGRGDGAPEALRAGQHWLRALDALLGGLLAAGTPVVLSSDHGNLENLRVKTHTLARVPLASSEQAIPPVTDVVAGGRWLAALLSLEG